mgnify:CR=1 FL=1
MHLCAGAFPRDLNIVKWQDPHFISRPDYLSLFVSFAGDKDDVLGLGPPDCFSNGFAAITDFDRIRGAFEDRCPNCARILSARIVIGNDHNLAAACSSCAHFRTFALVPVTASTTGIARAVASIGIHLKTNRSTDAISVSRAIQAWRSMANAPRRIPDREGYSASSL